MATGMSFCARFSGSSKKGTPQEWDARTGATGGWRTLDFRASQV